MASTVAFPLTRRCIPTRQHYSAPSDDEERAYRNVPEDAQRRLLFSQPLTAAASTLVAMTTTLPANAAPPMTIQESDGFNARLDRSRRPKPPKTLRSTLNQDFAVLLMRSSYVALDQLDCIAMDQFQRDFFLIRQAEYLPYIELIGPGVVQQGMLTDPYYFDFISFAQYATISREVNKDPAVVFEEQQPQETKDEDDAPQVFVAKVIKRDVSVLPNNMLASQHGKLVGKAIIDKLEETFGSTASAIPQMKAGDSASIVAALTQLAKLFQVNGFAFGASASYEDGEYCVTLLNPANLWSGKALQQRKADPINCFLLKAAMELASRSGLVVAASSVKYEGNQEKTFLKIV